MNPRETASAATVDWERLAHYFADELVDRWNEVGEDSAVYGLADFMGLTGAQYSAWVECRYAEVLDAKP